MATAEAAARARKGKANLSHKVSVSEDATWYNLIKLEEIPEGNGRGLRAWKWEISHPSGTNITGIYTGAYDAALGSLSRTIARLKNPADPLRWKSATKRIYEQLKREGKRA